MILKELVQIDNRFEKSVNLSLDIHDAKKISNYIPTRSSVRLLCDYISEIKDFSGLRSSVLVGPYGKGKSHLLLVLLEMLYKNSNQSEVKELVRRIKEVDLARGQLIETTLEKTNSFLPVIINANNGNLKQAFHRALRNALTRENLSEITPDSYYSEAENTIEKWKASYALTYKQFVQEISPESENGFIQKLRQCDENALKKFIDIFPKLTSGSLFNPLVEEDVIAVYKSINRILCSKYGYSGMVIIFDEFSKYIEGHQLEGFAEDMKILQDVCELCNSSKEEQALLICVAHKSIKSYGNHLAKEIVDTFKGVEGRLYEKLFVVSSQNSYELIADAINKQEAFSTWSKKNELYAEQISDALRMKNFTSIFSEDEYIKTVGKGCFPLTPVSAMLLLNLAEKIAQNERTVFTFIASREPMSLTQIVDSSKDDLFVGTDAIYDYFEHTFKEESYPEIHHEWLKADLALATVSDKKEQKIIKSLAIIHMINKPDEMPANKVYLKNACGLSEQEFQSYIKVLSDKNLIQLKSRTATYEFKNNIGIDVESAINDCINKHYIKVDPSSALQKVSGSKYVLPKRHNQSHSMTRYFSVCFMSGQQFLKLKSLSYIQTKYNPDGYVVLIVSDETTSEIDIEKALGDLEENNIVVCMPMDTNICIGEIQKYLAIREMLQEPSVHENEVLVKELELIEQDIELDINDWITNTYFDKPQYLYKGTANTKGKSLNRVVSDLCDEVYCKTPIINHELINRHEISSQVLKARSTLIDDLLNVRSLEKYRDGTSAESTICRATLLQENNESLLCIRNVISEFICSCVGTRKSFAELIKKLIRVPFGMRKGPMGLFLAESFVKMEGVPVIYLHDKEVNVDSETINNILRGPEEYSLFIEEGTKAKEEYLKRLEKVFEDISGYCRKVDERNKLNKIICLMQSWYRSLPQISVLYMEADEEGQDIESIKSFRKILSASYINARETLFEIIPDIFKSDNYDEILESIKATKSAIDSHLEIVTRKCIDCLKVKFEIPNDSNLVLGIRDWYNELPEIIRNSVLQGKTNKFLQIIKEQKTSSESEFVRSVAKTLTGNHLEDWKPHYLQNFASEIDSVLSDTKKSSSAESQCSKKITISYGSKVQDYYYDFQTDNISATGTFFKNSITEVLDDYEQSLDNKEKIGILLNEVEKLMR